MRPSQTTDDDLISNSVTLTKIYVAWATTLAAFVIDIWEEGKLEDASTKSAGLSDVAFRNRSHLFLADITPDGLIDIRFI